MRDRSAKRGSKLAQSGLIPVYLPVILFINLTLLPTSQRNAHRDPLLALSAPFGFFFTLQG